jgi:hypothetical protein
VPASGWQKTWFAAQLEPQWPPVHAWLPPHTWPHDPQLALSELMLAQYGLPASGWQ